MSLKNKVLAITMSIITLFTLMVPANATNTIQYVCNTTTFPAADDSSFRMNLPFSLKLGNTEYSDVYASTNGVLSFGLSDGTYWDYPQTPSISVAGWDWVTWGNGAYLRYGVTENTLCVQWAVRPYPNSSGDLTYIDLKIVKYPNGGWNGEITSTGWLPDSLRRGIRYAAGEPIVNIDTTFSVNGGQPVETKTCWDNSVIPVSQDCPATPQPTIETRQIQCYGNNPYTGEAATWTGNQRYYLYYDGRTEDIDTIQDACDASRPNFPIPPPEIKTKTITCTGNNPVDNSEIRWTTEQQYKLYWDGRVEDIGSSTELCNNSDPSLNNVDAVVVLENGVELTVTVAQALELFDSPSDLVNAIFTNPSQAITAIMNLGADMTREQKKQAQKTIIPAVIVTQIVSTTTSITLIRRVR